MDPAQLLISKGFKLVAYKRNPEKRRPCYYRNFPKGCQGKRYTRLLVYIGSDDLLVCWETKIWPARYCSRDVKLNLQGLAEEALLNTMRSEWRGMAANFNKVEMKDRRKPATEGEVEARVSQLAGTPSDILGQLAVSVIKALGLDDVQDLAKVLAAQKRRKAKKAPEGQMSLPGVDA